MSSKLRSTSQLRSTSKPKSSQQKSTLGKST